MPWWSAWLAKALRLRAVQAAVRVSNHLVGHVAADLLEHGPLPERCVALLVSGGAIPRCSRLRTSPTAWWSWARQSTTPQARRGTDKVARVLGLPYPGGPYIDRAATGDPGYVRFPRGLTARKDLERHRLGLLRPQDRCGSLGRGETA